MKDLKGRVVAITGAGSGIGRALAHVLARRGCHLAISDVHFEALEAVAEELRDIGVVVTIHVVDVAQPDAVEQFAADVVQAHGRCHVIINNAGLTSSGSFLEHELATWHRIVSVNLMGVVHGCRAFLPHFLEHNEGHIVNISSLFGIIGIRGQSAYCATKFAVRGLSESLWTELIHTRIGMTVVHPGGIATNIVRHSDFADNELKTHMLKLFDKHMMPAEDAAEIIVRGIERNRKRVLITKEARLGDRLKRLMPVRAVHMFENIMVKGLRLGSFNLSARLKPRDESSPNS